MKLPVMSASRSSSFFPAAARAEAVGLQLADSAESRAFWNCVRVMYFDGNQNNTTPLRDYMENLCPNGNLDCYTENAGWIPAFPNQEMGFHMLNQCWPAYDRGGAGGPWVPGVL